MKKLIYLIVLALILGLVLTGCLLSNIGQVPVTDQSGITYLTKHTEDAPQETILFAGQTIDVGTVSVWNNADYLYVKYELNQGTIGEGWCLTETHLAVVTDENDFPTNKAGNPKVGHFPYQCSYNGSEWVFQIKEDGDTGAGCDADSLTEACLTAIIYTIPLDWEPDTQLFIAAPAVMKRTEPRTFMPDLAWQRSLEPDDTMFFPGYGAAWTPTQAFAIPLDPEQKVWDNGLYYNNSALTGRDWASWKYAYNNGGSYDGYSDLRRFQATFTIPDGYTVTGGSLYVPHYTSGIPINDNVYIFVNGEDNLLFWGGTRVYTGQIPNTFLGVTGRAAARGTTEPKETDLWYIPGTIPEVTGFIPDENVIDIFTEENERWGGMGKLVFEFSYEKTYSESAWATGTRFTEQGNWATYFTYKVQGWHLIESLTIEANSTIGTSSSALELGKSYMFKASGTWQDNSTQNHHIDAEYTTFGLPEWDAPTDGTTNWGPDQKDLQVNELFVDWGAYSEDHVYTLMFDGAGLIVNFRVFDGKANASPPVMMSGWYPDNEGSLTVDIYKWY